MVLLITLCIAFLSSNVIYAENIDQSVTFNNTTGEIALNNSNTTSDNSSNTDISDLGAQQTYNVHSTELKEEAGIDTSLAQNASEDSQYQNPSSDSLQNESNKTKEVKAAGDSKNSITFDLKSIKDASNKVRAYIEKYKKLPSYVEISNQHVPISEFLYLLVKGINNANLGSTSKISWKTVNDPKNPSGNFNAGSLTKKEYITLTGNVAKYIEKYGKAPNYATTKLGKIQYQNVIYVMTKIMDFYKQKGRLPSFVSVPKTTIKVNSSETSTSKINEAYQGENLSNYLKSTTNCQVSDPNIKALAASLTKGLTSTSDKANKIFKWVRDNLKYEFYYNTKYGAAKTLLNKSGNCVDHTHLLVALSRAAGIPARYVHGTCKFNSGNTYGHVWGQLLVNGVWYAADATSYSNSIGTINNWNVSSATIKSKYAELPF